MPELSMLSIALLFITAVFAGFIDSIAGGGGILTLPALLAAGLPPHLALGTNKLQACFGSLTATLNYRHGKLISFRDLKFGVLFTALGAIVGSVTIQTLSSTFLHQIIPILLGIIFVYVLLNPNLGKISAVSRFTPLPFYFLFGCLIGFYDGFFGPGTGSFWTLSFIFFLGFDMKKATAHTKLLNFTSNFISLIVFSLGGHVLLTIGLIMGAGQILGAFIGSHLVLKRGTEFIRIFFLIAVAATFIRMVYKQYF